MKALREKTPRAFVLLIETYRIHTVYRNQTCFNFRFPPASLPQLYPGDLGGGSCRRCSAVNGRKTGSGSILSDSSSLSGELRNYR